MVGGQKLVTGVGRAVRDRPGGCGVWGGSCRAISLALVIKFKNNSDRPTALIPIAGSMRSADGIASSWQSYDQGRRLGCRKMNGFCLNPGCALSTRRSM